MPYPNEHSVRMRDPGQFNKFRRENDKFGSGIDVIWGIRDGKTEIQSIRFNKNKFSESQVKSWLKEHDMKPISFEPAAEKVEESTLSGDIASTNSPMGELQSRYKYDKELNGYPVFVVSPDDYTRMSVARRQGTRYNIQDERIRNFMKDTGYRKPFCVECNGQVVRIDYRTNNFRR